MTKNALLFIENQMKDETKITFGDKSKGQIISCGKVGKHFSTSLDTVHLVEGLKFNLLFVSQMFDKRNKFTFTLLNYNVVNSNTSRVTLFRSTIGHTYVVCLDEIKVKNHTSLKVYYDGCWLGIRD